MAPGARTAQSPASPAGPQRRPVQPAAQPDLEKALEYYRQALEIDPAHRGAHEYIGEAYLMRNQPTKAREHLQTLQRLCGGTTCEEYQDLAKALAAYPE
ncbi:MAG: tetratricopeptide repeat protein [Hydrogenophaga sp.]|nr:tetratricopeptide repeat protein [Hydrogenophaga sp.]